MSDVYHDRQFYCDVYPVWPPDIGHYKLGLHVKCTSYATSRDFAQELREWASCIEAWPDGSQFIRIDWTFVSAVHAHAPPNDLVVQVECPDGAAVRAFAVELVEWATFIESCCADNQDKVAT